MLKKSSNHNKRYIYTNFFGKRHVIIVIIVILLVSLAISKKKYIQNVSHTAELETLDAFINSKVKCLALYSFTQNNSKYYIWIGDNQSISRLLYSAPPAYVFDENGILIDFSLDFDSRPFSQRWYWKKSAKRLENFPKIQIIHPMLDKPAGDHVQTTTDSAVETQTFNKANEIIAINNNSNAVSNDRNGNMTRIPGKDLTYDAWNRLVRVSNEIGTIAEYGYDALNRRVLKHTYDPTSSMPLIETREYYYNRNWQCLEELVYGNCVVRYQWGLRYIDDLVGFTSSYDFALTDANFNVVAVVNQTNVPERYTYSAFGSRTVRDEDFNIKSTTSYPTLTRAFTGQVLDPDTGLMLYSNRYYSPSLGRFITRDPIGYEGNDVNLYRYIQNTNLSSNDYLGLMGFPPRKSVSPITVNDKRELNDEEVCREMEKYLPNSGYVAIYKDRLIPCSFIAIRNIEMTLDQQIQHKCILEHENVHIRQIRNNAKYLSSYEIPGNTGIKYSCVTKGWPKFKYEFEAYCVNLECLIRERNRYKECQKGTDCFQKIENTIKYVTKVLYSYREKYNHLTKETIDCEALKNVPYRLKK